MFRGSHRSCSVKKRCSKKFCKIHRKIPAPESLNKVAGLRHTCFPINFAKFLRPLLLQNTSGRLLLNFVILELSKIFIYSFKVSLAFLFFVGNTK